MTHLSTLSEDEGGINEEDLEYQISLPLKLEILSNQVNQSRIENHFLKRKDELDLYKYNVIRMIQLFLYLFC